MQGFVLKASHGELLCYQRNELKILDIKNRAKKILKNIKKLNGEIENEKKKHNISPKYFSGNTWQSSHKADPDTILAENFFQRYR